MSQRITKHIEMTVEIAEYVEELHAHAEDRGSLDILDQTWQGGDSFLQIPLSEAKFLSLFVRAVRAKRVLELGTFRGWSAAWIAKTLPEDGRLISIDHDPRIELDARELWRMLGIESKIDFRIGEVIEQLHSIVDNKEKFDLVFIDATKAEYKDYLELSYEVLEERGAMLIDNTLCAGHAVDQSLDNRTKNMKDFNEYVFSRYGQSACLIPAWDGVIMIIKAK